MTSTRHVIDMIRSHAAGDDDQFLSVAESIAEEAGRAGRNRVAGDIREVVESVRRHLDDKRSARPVPMVSPRGELAGLVRASYPDIRASDLVLGPDLERRVNRLVLEHRRKDVLAAKNLAPRRKFLFSGPPGTGKSMTAAAIAGELGLPLFTIMLDGVITKFMGETAAKLRLIFDAMRTTKGVYFFDEVDALAGSRDAQNDIGEARRMLNSFLQFLEDDDSSSIIVAATNHRSLLDAAIFRRFHGAFVYAPPSADEAVKLLTNHMLQFDRDEIDWTAIRSEVGGLSQADLVAAADDAAREAVLEHRARLSTEVILQAIRDRQSLHED